MIAINNVILTLLVCLESKSVFDKLSEEYELKIRKLENYDVYLNSDDFKNKVVNESNLDTCLLFSINKLSDESIRIFMERNKICHTVFYKKEKQKSDILKSNAKDTQFIKTLNSMATKYEIEGTNLVFYIPPIENFRTRIVENSDIILKYFNSHNKNVDTITTRYFYNDKVVDDLGETFINLGFNLK